MMTQQRSRVVNLKACNNVQVHRFLVLYEIQEFPFQEGVLLSKPVSGNLRIYPALLFPGLMRLQGQ